MPPSRQMCVTKPKQQKTEGRTEPRAKKLRLNQGDDQGQANGLGYLGKWGKASG